MSQRYFVACLFLALLASPARGQPTNALLVNDPRVQVAVDLRDHGLIEDSKRLLVQICHDTGAPDQARADAYYWLGEIAYQEGNFNAAYLDWMRIATDFPDSQKAELARLRIHWLLIEGRLLTVTTPKMWVINEVEIDGLRRPTLTFKGIGIYLAAPLNRYWQLVVVTNEKVWGDRQVIINQDELEGLVKALQSMKGVRKKWMMREGQRGRVDYTTRNGLVIGFEQKPKLEYRGPNRVPGDDELVWFLQIEDRVLEIEDADFLDAFVAKLDEGIGSTDGMDPSDWFEKEE